MAPRRLDVALPPSVLPSHPDYTRERYSVSQAAAYLSVSRDHVYAEACARRLSHLRVGGGIRARLLFAQSDLDGWRRPRRIEAHASSAPLMFPIGEPVLPKPRKERFS